MGNGKFFGKRLTPAKAPLQEKSNTEELTYDHLEAVLKGAYLEIELCYEVKFLEIGTNRDHVHFLVQSAPTYSVTKLVTMIKSLTAREVFRECPQVRKML